MRRETAIADLALVGDTRTAALIDSRGEVVWLCLPHFDGDPVFASLLAGPGGGSFLLGPAGQARVLARRYRPGSAVVETTWQVADSRLVMTEGMVTEIEGGLFPTSCLVRRVEARGRAVTCALRFDPRFGVDRHAPRTRRTAGGLVCVEREVAVS